MGKVTDIREHKEVKAREKAQKELEYAFTPYSKGGAWNDSRSLNKAWERLIKG